MENFTLLSNEVLRSSKLKANKKMVLMVIISLYNKKYGYASVTGRELMEYTGVSKPILLKILKELQEDEYITIDSGIGANVNRYKINQKYLVGEA